MRAALSVPLVEANPADAEMILETLAAATDARFNVEWVTQLSSRLDRLRKGGVEAVLIDLVPPDSQGIEAFEKLSLAAAHVPILSLSAIDTEGIAGQAVQRGAQDDSSTTDSIATV
jgi:glutamate dehydrogenase (NAD(P)+)